MMIDKSFSENQWTMISGNQWSGKGRLQKGQWSYGCRGSSHPESQSHWGSLQGWRQKRKNSCDFRAPSHPFPVGFRDAVKVWRRNQCHKTKKKQLTWLKNMNLYERRQRELLAHHGLTNMRNMKTNWGIWPHHVALKPNGLGTLLKVRKRYQVINTRKWKRNSLRTTRLPNARMLWFPRCLEWLSQI